MRFALLGTALLLVSMIAKSANAESTPNIPQFRGIYIEQPITNSTSNDLGQVEIVPSVGHTTRVHFGLISSDNSRLATTEEGGHLKLWNIANGALVRTILHAGRPIKFEANNQRLLTYEDDSKSMLSWDLSSGRQISSARRTSNQAPPNEGPMPTKNELRSLGDLGHATVLCISPDRRLIAVAKGGQYGGLDVEQDFQIDLYDTSSGKLVQTTQGSASAVTDISISDDGIAIARNDNQTFSKWNIHSGRRLRSFKLRESDRLALSKRILLTSTANYSFGVSMINRASKRKNGVAGWNPNSGDLIFDLDMNLSQGDVGLSHGGRLAVWGLFDQSVELREAETGRLLNSLEGYRHDWGDRKVYRQFIKEKRAAETDVVTPDPDFEKYTGVTSSISAAFSPDDRSIATARNGTAPSQHPIKMWEVASGKLLFNFNGRGKRVNSIAFSPNGKQVIAGSEAPIEMFDARSGRSILTFGATSNDSFQIKISPNGSVAAAMKKNAISLWDTTNGRFIRQISNGNVLSTFRFDESGSRIIAAYLDGTIRIWKTDTTELLATAISFNNAEWVTITPEGFFDSSENGAKLIQIVRGTDSFSLDQFYEHFHRPYLVQQKLAGDPAGKVAAAAAQNRVVEAAEGKPPQVTIVKPILSTAMSVDYAEVTVQISPRGAGIGRVEWRVNGTPFAVNGPGTLSVAGDGSATVTKKLPLSIGENKIEVVAFNARNSFEPDEISRGKTTINRLKENSNVKPRLFGLVVGVDEYVSPVVAKLNFAESDAQSVGEGLRKGAAQLYGDVEIVSVVKKQVRKDYLSQKFSELGRKIRPQDVFVLFMAGHGKTIDGKFYYLPQDFNGRDEEAITHQGISQSMLENWLTQIPSQHSVILVDACESGSLIEEQKTAFDRMARLSNRTVVTATTDVQRAAEGYRGHGLFTYSLLISLGEGVRDGQPITMLQLATGITVHVKEIAKDTWQVDQDPNLFFKGTNFELVSKVTGLVDK